MASTAVGKQTDDDEGDWNNFNPFIGDRAKHSELLERMAADADAFFSDDYNDDSENSNEDSGGERALGNAAEVSILPSVGTEQRTSKSKQRDDEATCCRNRTVEDSLSASRSDAPDMATPDFHTKNSVFGKSKYSDKQYGPSAGAASSVGPSGIVAESPAAGLPENSKASKKSVSTTVQKTAKAVQSGNKEIAHSRGAKYAHQGVHKRGNLVPCSPDQPEPSENGYLENKQNLGNPDTHVEKSFNSPSCHSYCPVPSFSACIQDSKLLENYYKERGAGETSWYLAEASYNTSLGLSAQTTLTVWQCGGEQGAVFLWDTTLPSHHLATHLHILYPETLLNGTAEISEVECPRSDTNETNSTTYCAEKAERRHVDNTEPTTMPPVEGSSADNVKYGEPEARTPVPGFVLLVTTIPQNLSASGDFWLRPHFAAADKSYISLYDASSGLPIISSFPLDGGVVSQVVLAQPRAPESSSSLPFTKLFGPAATSQLSLDHVQLPIVTFGLLTCFGTFHLFDVGVNRYTLSRSTFPVIETSPFRHRAISLGSLNADVVPVSVHSIALIRLRRSSRTRLFIVFSTGEVFCFDEYGLAHRLDALAYPNTDYSAYPTGLFNQFSDNDNDDDFFSSLETLQRKSWRVHHEQQASKNPTLESTTSRHFTELLLDCLRSTSLGSDLPIKSQPGETDRVLSKLCDEQIMHFFLSEATKSKQPVVMLSYEHLLHQVQASAVLASSSEFLSWFQLLCNRILEQGRKAVFQTIIDALSSSMLEDGKKNVLSAFVPPCWLEKTNFSSLKLEEKPASNIQTRETWGNYNSPTLNNASVINDPNNLLSPTLLSYAKYGNAFERDSALNKKTGKGAQKGFGCSPIWWAHGAVLREMDLKAENVLFHIILKPFCPESMWKPLVQSHTSNDYSVNGQTSGSSTVDSSLKLNFSQVTNHTGIVNESAKANTSFHNPPCPDTPSTVPENNDSAFVLLTESESQALINQFIRVHQAIEEYKNLLLRIYAVAEPKTAFPSCSKENSDLSDVRSVTQVSENVGEIVAKHFLPRVSSFSRPLK